MTDTNWQESALQNLLLETVREQRRRRRWGIFFKLTLIAFIIFMGYSLFYDDGNTRAVRDTPHTSLIDISGPIMDGGDADADRVATSLRHAFDDKGTKGIILRINSPGGSPVQSDYIYNEVHRLEKLHPGIKVYAVCEDICASGAYYIAASADQIYADPASLVGSIGVIMDGFGFTDIMKRYGISRRLFTAGDHKGFLDPFSPLKPAEEKEVQVMLNTIHKQFINAVKTGRGKRLKSDPNLFSGLIWTGEQAKALGLIDTFGSAGYVAREVIKEDKIVDYTLRPNYFERIAGKIGASAGDRLVKQMGLEQNLQLK